MESSYNFSSELGECWNEYADIYNQLEKDYDLNEN